MTEFRYLTAIEWGLRWDRSPVTERQPDPEAYVHHTAGNHPVDAVSALRALNEAAIREGMSAMDYDIAVHRNPNTGLVTIAEGRGPWMSAATRDRNDTGEATVLMGYFHPGHSLSRQPHPDELEGIALAHVWGIEKGWIARDAKILGHRDNPAHPNATACPGNYLYAHLPAIRSRVQGLLTPAPPPAPTPAPGGHIVPDIYVPNEQIKDAPPAVNGLPVDANWLWAIAYQQWFIERPGTASGPPWGGIVRLTQWNLNNAIALGMIPGPELPLDGIYSQRTAEALRSWLQRK